MPFDSCPEVIGQVPAQMFDDIQAVKQDRVVGDHTYATFRFENHLSSMQQRFYEALYPLAQLIVERETARIQTLDIDTTFAALPRERYSDIDFWHRDGNTFSRIVSYAVAMGLGTEFLVRLKPDTTPPDGLDVVGKLGRLTIVRPQSLTVVRFIKQRHRRPIASSPNKEARGWVRASVNTV